MKKYYLACVMFLSVTSLAFAQHSADTVRMDTDGSVRRVILYRTMASITQEVEFKAAGNDIYLRLQGLPETIEPETIGIDVLCKDMSVISFALEPTLDSVSDSYRDKLEADRDHLSRSLSALTDEKMILQQERRALLLYQNMIPRAVSEQAIGKVDTPQIQQWNEAVDFINTRTPLNEQALRENALKSADLSDALHRVNGTLLQLPKNARAITQTLCVHLRNTSKKPNGSLRLSYLTNKAFWTPFYSLTQQSEDSVRFVYNAKITQNTPSPWKNAAISFSTEAPQTRLLKPQSAPIWISAQAQTSQAAPRFVLTDVQDLLPDPEYTATKMIKSSAENDVTLCEKSLTVPAGNTAMNVILFDTIIPAKTQHYAVAFAYTQPISFLQICNPLAFALLPGAAEWINLQGAVTTTSMPFVSPNTPASVYAGANTAITMRYERTAYSQCERGIICPRPAQITTQKLILHNPSNQPQSVSCFERVPVSLSDLAEIRILSHAYGEHPATTPGFVFNKKTGGVSWNIELQPGESKIIYLTWQNLLR